MLNLDWKMAVASLVTATDLAETSVVTELAEEFDSPPGRTCVWG